MRDHGCGCGRGRWTGAKRVGCGCLLLSLLLAGGAGAAETIDGRVTEPGKETVRIATDSEWLPNPGDPVEIHVVMPGQEAGVIVGRGRVTEVDGGAIAARLDKVLAETKAGDLARITSGSPRRRSASGASAGGPEEPPARIASPDGASSVRILHEAMPGAEDPLLNFFTLEVLRGDKVVARAPTFGYLLSAHWSPDGRLVAINNRRGNSGDYLWVFSIEDGACLKRADDALGMRWAGAARAEIEDGAKGASADTMIRDWLTAGGWSAAGELLVNFRARYRGPGAFDFNAPVILRNGKLVLQEGVVKPAE